MHRGKKCVFFLVKLRAASASSYYLLVSRRPISTSIDQHLARRLSEGSADVIRDHYTMESMYEDEFDDSYEGMVRYDTMEGTPHYC